MMFGVLFLKECRQVLKSLVITAALLLQGSDLWDTGGYPGISDRTRRLAFAGDYGGTCPVFFDHRAYRYDSCSVCTGGMGNREPFLCIHISRGFRYETGSKMEYAWSNCPLRYFGEGAFV